MRKEELIKSPENKGIHIVLLGAGASRAAFPQGDLNGQMLPTMIDLIETVDLTSLLEEVKIYPDKTSNFEVFYSNLSSKIENKELLRGIENKIRNYFSNLKLPLTATHYDRILLSLRPKDAIFTFNWDPFLFDAYIRNKNIASLPGIFFLHGNVRVGACSTHYTFGNIGGLCPTCKTPYEEIPLLYPVENKDYSMDPFISQQWENAKKEFAQAFTITIFGYSAPISDKDAKELLKQAWLNQSTRQAEHIEIIDIETTDILQERWQGFSSTDHFLYANCFTQSRCWNWPRRTCESLYYPMVYGEPCESFSLPNTNSLADLQKFISNLTIYEH